MDSRFIRVLHVAIDVIEVMVSLALVILAGAILVSLGFSLWGVTSNGFIITSAEFNQIIGIILEIFILVELYRIAIAYMRHENVIPTVLEAALVAVARKFVVLEASENFLFYALGLSSLLLAVALSWWMLARSNAMQEEGVTDRPPAVP